MNNRYELNAIRAAACYRWQEIHAALGIPRHLLDTRKHQTCLACGGKDRYRYTDYQGSGGFICNQCTLQGGSGFDLLMLVLGMVNDAAPRAVYTPKIAPATPKAQTDKQAALLQQWQSASPLQLNHVVAQYLIARGIPLTTANLPAQIRYIAHCEYWISETNGKPALFAAPPAMIAAITNTQGQLQGIHKTYLQETPQGWQKWHGIHPQTGEKLPAKKMQSRFSGSLKGAAVHMASPNQAGQILIAEGIETVLAARALFNLPAIAALSANGMRTLDLPPAAREIYICADNDHSKTGIHAAHDLAVRAIRLGIKAHIWQPETAGYDALDEYNARQQHNQRKDNDHV
ncbi:toprim domain-containing protein [Neisseriaceae bacterium B1]